MHDEYDSPNYIERKPLGPYGGPMIMMSGKAQIPMMGFFFFGVSESECVMRETPWLDQRLIDDTRDFKKQ